jgi:DNA-binding transcriptional ArsR family regulator
MHRVLETFAALAEPNRFRIVELLRSGPRSVNDISERLDLAQPQASKHLRVLKEAGLVDVEPRAQQRLYELRRQPLRRMHDWLERYRRIWDASFDQLDELIEELKDKENKARRSTMTASAGNDRAPGKTKLVLHGSTHRKRRSTAPSRPGWITACARRWSSSKRWSRRCTETPRTGHAGTLAAEREARPGSPAVPTPALTMHPAQPSR